MANPAFAIGTAYHKTLENYYNWEMPTEDALKLMLNKYLENPVEWTIIETEKKIEFQFEWINIILILDRLDEDKIVEYKTSSFNYKEADVDNWQTDIYIWIMYKLTGILYPMYYSVLNKKSVTSKKYKPQIIKVEKTLQDILDIEERFVKEIEKINNEQFLETPWNHCFYCPFSRKYWTWNCKSSK